MSAYYETLDPSVRELVLKPNLNVEQYFTGVTSTGENLWVPVPTGNLITPEGVQWFNERGIILATTTGIFRTKPGATGTTHIDSAPQKMGFNFIIQGTGSVEWVNVISQGQLQQYEIGDYINPKPDTIYKNPDIIEILDTWSTGDAVIKIDVPHRIMGGDVERYVISFRPNTNYQLANTFEQMMAPVLSVGLTA